MALKTDERLSGDHLSLHRCDGSATDIDDAPKLALGHGRCTKCSCQVFDSLAFSDVCQNQRCRHYITDHVTQEDYDD